MIRKVWVETSLFPQMCRTIAPRLAPESRRDLRRNRAGIAPDCRRLHCCEARSTARAAAVAVFHRTPISGNFSLSSLSDWADISSRSIVQHGVAHLVHLLLRMFQNKTEIVATKPVVKAPIKISSISLQYIHRKILRNSGPLRTHLLKQIGFLSRG